MIIGLHQIHKDVDEMKEKIRVLEVIDTYYPKFDGPVLVATSYAKVFAAQDDIEVEIAAPRFPNYTDNQPFKVNRIKSIKSKEGYRGALPALDRKFKKNLRSNKFDLIHCHSPFTMCAFLGKYGRKHRIPTVFTFHTKFKDDFERVFKTRLMKGIAMRYIMKNINRMDKVLTVSDGAAECLRGYGYKKNIEVIRNGTDLVYPENDRELIDRVNELRGLKSDEVVFLSVGRIVSNKKINLALESLKVVQDKGYNFKFLIVGAGPEEENLKSLTEKLGLTDKVIFTGKVMDRELLSAHYLRADLFLFPSTFDTASLAPIEAAALKLPTLMNEGCCTAEIITDKVNGLLAKENQDDWAEKIITSINDKQLMEKLKENCYKQVFRTWTSVAGEIKQFYFKIIKEYHNAGTK